MSRCVFGKQLKCDVESTELDKYVRGVADEFSGPENRTVRDAAGN